jgi:putative PIN family toxin of toxin-antitoxin system
VIVIVDTNVLVAGLASRNLGSPTKRLLAAIREGAQRALLSPELVAEYRDVLNRPQVLRWHGIQPPLPDRLITEMVGISQAAEPGRAVARAPDPGGQHLWDLLAEVPESVMVTGDKLLLESTDFPGRILTPRAFADAHLDPPPR